MIENYIEKDIVRQVKLSEYLLDLKTLPINDVATRLFVNSNTVKRDFQKLCVFLEEYILDSTITSKEISITFLPEISYYTLIKEIYKESKFLRVCSRYLIGETNYLDIVNKEFVSVTKAFHLKKKVEEFFISSGIMNENKQFIKNEVNYRLVVLSIWMRSDLLNEAVNDEDMHLAKGMCNYILGDFLNNHEIDDRDYNLFLFGTYLSIHRHENNLQLAISDDYYNEIISSSLTFEKFNNANKYMLNDNSLNTNEIIFLCFIYKAMSLKTDSYLLVETNYLIERTFTIERNPMIKQLIRKFEYEFKTVLLNEISFEKPFLNLINSMWSNIQVFIVDKHYYLTNEQIESINRIKHVLKEWQKEYNLTEVKFNSISIEKFCTQATTALMKKQEAKTIFIIVAKDELAHILYRENLKRWINLEFNTIDNMMYYNLDSIPVYIQSLPHIILCDRALMTVKSNHIFGISVPTINTDIKTILLNIIDNKFS